MLYDTQFMYNSMDCMQQTISAADWDTIDRECDLEAAHSTFMKETFKFPTHCTSTEANAKAPISALLQWGLENSKKGTDC